MLVHLIFYGDMLENYLVDSKYHISNEKQWEAATCATHFSGFAPEDGRGRQQYKP